MEIVLDKSFLIGATPEQLRSVLWDNTPCVPDVMFHELMKSDAHRARGFSRLRSGANNITVPPSIGPLMRYEIMHGAGTGSLSTHPLARAHKSVPEFSDPGYKRGQWILDDEREQTEIYADMAKRSFGMSRLIGTMFPRLETYKPGLKDWGERFAKAAEAIRSDDSIVRSVYAQMAKPDWPAASSLPRNSIFFRLFQVDLNYALVHFRAYGRAGLDAVPPKVNHDAKDRFYAVFALLAGGIATLDKPLATLLRAIEPDIRIVGEEIAD